MGTTVSQLPTVGSAGQQVVWNGQVYFWVNNAWVNTNQLDALFGSLPGERITANSVTAGRLNIGSLSAITPNVGILTQGILRGFANANNFLDLNATGTGRFIQVTNGAFGNALRGFYVDASGNAFFSGDIGAGTVQAIRGSFSTLSALSTDMGIVLNGVLKAASNDSVF